jgi:hypothetical protein
MAALQVQKLAIAGNATSAENVAQHQEGNRQLEIEAA